MRPFTRVFYLGKQGVAKAKAQGVKGQEITYTECCYCGGTAIVTDRTKVGKNEYACDKCLENECRSAHK